MSPEIILDRIKRTESHLIEDMKNHYSQPKGFVGRNLCFSILDKFGNRYGSIVAGSTPKYLPGRNSFFYSKGLKVPPLNCIVNNIFYRVYKVNNKYPCSNFTIKLIQIFRFRVFFLWKQEYGDDVKSFETLVELPRTGEIYKRDNWSEMGQTKGFTCKRTSGIGTDSYSGKRVWDTVNLRPKLVFMRLPL